MGLEYTLEIASQVQPIELLQLLFEGAQPRADGDDWNLAQPGFMVKANPISHPHPLALQMEVASNLRMVLELGGVVNYAVAMSNILNTVVRVLEETKSDLIFYVADVDMLLWRKEELFLNEASSFWSPSFLIQVHLPYKLQAIKPLVEA